MRKPPASGVASKTRLPRQSIIATPLMYLGHKKWFTGAGAGLRNAARPIDGQAVGGQHPLRPVLNTSARFCPGVPGIPGHFLKYFQGLLNVFSLWIEGLGNLRCETADERWTTWMLPREGHEDLLWRGLDGFSSQTVRNMKTLLQGEDVSRGLTLKRAGISLAVVAGEVAGVLQSLDMQ
ncbi:uncharacterized protein LOC115343664 isoform X3 [Aquila chrysaetos chrysaetos]|uniref:uncharacterized protein LOC115343664 isoform X3 n=1 Tax=Aquila chrysaetos chrysaetos TaxID=223781 RepID=UPI00117727FA|nr:uncharacterized protein LOC115343664 isoform X3 [Aquila chrysaetos chrysaetos]